MNALRLIPATLCTMAGVLVFAGTSARAAAPLIESESVLKVTASSATLEAEVNPGEQEIAYHFEYDTRAYNLGEAPHGTSVPIPDGEIAAGSAGVTVGQLVQKGLAPATTYYYRVVTSNAEGTVEGRSETFTTQPEAGGDALPNGRAWEQVSPVEKLGAQAVSDAGNAVIQAAEDGGAISYYLTAPFSDSAPASDLDTQVISRRAANGGWITEDIATPHDKATLFTPEEEYKFFSANLSQAVVEPLGETPLSREALEERPYEPAPYVRDDETGSYSALVSPANVPSGTKFGEMADTNPGVMFVTATPDLSHVVLTSEHALTGEAGEAGNYKYYEWTPGPEGDPGRLRLISAQPAGEPELPQITGRAISREGTRFVWTTNVPGDGGVYITNTADGEALRLDRSQIGASPESVEARAKFQGASADGSRVFFTDTEPLTQGAGAHEGNLYVCEVTEVDGKLACDLEDLTVPENAGEPASVQGTLLGTGEAGNYVYFVAEGVLTSTANNAGEQAQSGTDNLYVRHYEGGAWAAPVFIARLASGQDPTGDEPDWENEPGSSSTPPIEAHTAEVSNNGQYLTFMSERSLTGYDNTDVNEASGRHADEEVYLYDAQDGRLSCASCDPTGARPVGWEEPLFTRSDSKGFWAYRWVAATLPDETMNMRLKLGARPYRPQYLMDSGRLFFNSHDGLVPADNNGVGDVYEYEPAGVGGCSTSTGNLRVVFAPQASGCVGLISGGFGPDESLFADASGRGPGGEEGEDVFFATTDALVPQDVGTEYNMYDAHVCSEAVPCPAAAPVVPAPCASADACKAAVSAQPALFGAPPSATFSGSGNLAPVPAVVVKAKAMRLTRGQKLVKALKACAGKPKRRRAACVRQARKRYGPLEGAKMTKTSRGGRS
jgi:hypothetical protein